jgi:hypothetical protein
LAYVALEASIRTHRKFLAAGPAASWLWVCGLCHCQEGLTDGFIPDSVVDYLGVKPRDARRLAIDLVKAGLWDRAEGGWQIHDYLDHNKSGDQVRQIMRKRAEGGRLGGRPRAETLEVNHQGSDKNGTSQTLPETLSGSSGSSDRPTVQDREDQEPRADARRAHLESVPLDSVRLHLLAAAHAVLDQQPDIDDGDLAHELKAAAAKLRTSYTGREIQKIVDAVRGERQRRRP